MSEENDKKVFMKGALKSLGKTVGSQIKDAVEVGEYQANRFLPINMISDVASTIRERRNEESSPINSDSAGAVNPVQTPAQANINSQEKVENKNNENVSGEITAVTEGKPEVTPIENKPIVPSTNINLNLEKKDESQALNQTTTVNPIGAVNSPQATTGSPVENKNIETVVNQQNINLSTDASSNPMTSNSTQNVSNTTNSQTSTGNSVLNSASTEVKSDSSKLLQKVKFAAAGVLNPLGESLASQGKDALKVASSQLEKMGVPINLINKITERRNEKKSTATNSSINNTETVSNSPTSVSADRVENTTTNNTSVTQNNPTAPTESMIERSNPSVVGNPTTASPEKKVETQSQVNNPAPVQQPMISEVRNEPKTSAVSNSEPAPAPNVMIDLASLETRLKRIEMALSNPLEVIIKEA